MGRAALLLAAIAVGSGCSGCKGDSPKVDAQAVSPVEGLSAEEAGQVLARVGDRTITVGDFVIALSHMDQFDRMRFQAPERRKELLGEMIDVMLLADEAREKGYDKDPETQEELRQVLRDAVLKKAREGAPAPNDIPADEVRAYYDAHRGDFQDPERRRLSLIVVASEAAAKAVLAQGLKASALEWGELVRSKSTAPGAKANVPADLAGDFGFVNPPNDPHSPAVAQVPDEVRAAAFEIPKEGDVLPRVVPAGGKFYVVRLTKKTSPHDRSFDEASRMIRVKLSQQKAQAMEAALLDQLRKDFPVKIDEAALAQVHAETPPPAPAASGSAGRP
jgi:parvulin-like peptidyl-prolyl isomerase